MIIFPGLTFNNICSPTYYNPASPGRTFPPGTALMSSPHPSHGPFRHCWRKLWRNPSRSRATRVPSLALPLGCARLRTLMCLFSTGTDHCCPFRLRLHPRWTHQFPWTMPLRFPVTPLLTLPSFFHLRASLTFPGGPSRSQTSPPLRPTRCGPTLLAPGDWNSVSTTIYSPAFDPSH